MARGSGDVADREIAVGTGAPLRSDASARSAFAPRGTGADGFAQSPSQSPMQSTEQSTVQSPRLLLEVNVSGEASKHGFSPDELRAAWPEITTFASLDITGLMTMAPETDDPKTARPHFRSLRRLRDQLAAAGSLSLPDLSMGMSGDFEVAIEEGATLVRIGTALLGERPRKQAPSA